MACGQRYQYGWPQFEDAAAILLFPRASIREADVADALWRELVRRVIQAR
jgi:hypothetical protein